MDLTILETGRLRLRYQSTADVDFLVALWSDPEATRFMGGPRDRDLLRWEFETVAAHPQAEIYDLWPVEHRSTNELVGYAGFIPKTVEGTEYIEPEGRPLPSKSFSVLEKGMKSAFAAIVGRPSSGKSTLLNALCGHKVSIVSPVPQTTRNQVRGIVNRPDQGQIVFLDTPGFHLSEKKFNKSMMDNVTRSLSDADVVVYLIDASRKAGSEEEGLMARLATLRKPLIVALNKTELKPNYADQLETWVGEHMSPKAVVRISALKETGLEAFFDALFAQASEGEAFYPAEFYTDQDPSFRIAEIVREQAINRLNDEIPHALYVEVADRELREAPPAEGAKPVPTLWLRVFLIVERESQVGIVVGRGGEKIKEIRQAAQKELGKIFTQRIHLDLRCKADPKWRTKDHLIKDILGSTQPKEE